MRYTSTGRIDYNNILYKTSMSYDNAGLTVKYPDGAFALDQDRWVVSIEEREHLIPNIKLGHYHTRRGTAILGNVVDGSVCDWCHERSPEGIINASIEKARAEAPSLYAAVNISDGRIRTMKELSEGWLLNNNKNQKEPSLHHICNTTHPGYLYYGRGIPLSWLTLNPRPNCCKTCSVEIPKGIRMALLMTRSKMKL